MIGIFDSGIGGLTVTKGISCIGYPLLYLGDTARTPYGNRSQELIYEFTKQAVDYLFKQGCELIIVACNTASAEALRKIQQEYLSKNYPDKKVLGVIRPIAEAAAQVSKNKNIGVIGTRGTINSGAYTRELQKLNSEIKVYQQACPLLVPLIEEGLQDKPETKKIIKNYLRSLQGRDIDTLILGCTHYPVLLKQIRAAANKKVKVLDSGEIIADKLKDYLNRHPEVEKKLLKNNQHRFLVTDLTENFKKNAQQWLGESVEWEEINLV